MIDFKASKKLELFPFLTVKQIQRLAQEVKPVGLARLIKEKDTGKVWVLKLRYDSKPYISISHEKVPSSLLKTSPSEGNINLMLFLNQRDLDNFEDRSKDNIIEITNNEFITYDHSSMYEALCKEYKLIIYND